MSFEAGSFRDRAARVFYADGEVFRALSERGLADWQALSATRFFRRLSDEGTLVATEQVTTGEAAIPAGDGEWAGLLRHQRVPFISYPYEWSAGMLRAAALLQLDLLEAALEEDFVLKDATPYNVQWLGTRPVFIDLLSFCRWQPGDPWVGYRQFCELFLYPLMLQAYKGVPFQPWLRGSIDGIPPADAARLLSGRDLLRRGFERVWDLGANTGEYARLAAEHADYVVALDADRVVVERMFERCRHHGPDNLLPLVCDLANPSPNQGWRGAERRDLVARGTPDLVLALALIHHLVLGANVRLADLLDWLAELAPRLVIEFVRRDDPMVERLLRNKEDLYADYDLEAFEAELGRRYRVLRRQELPSGRRILYFAEAPTAP